MNRKILLIVSIVLIAGIAIETKVYFDNSKPSDNTNGDSGVLTVHTIPDETETPRNTTETKEYVDGANGYKVGYPGDLVISSKDTEVVSFAESAGGPWQISIRVSTTSVATADLWTKEQDAKYGGETVVEKHITIDGLDTLVTHHSDGVESFPNEKTAVVIKGGKAFQISTRNVDHEKVWGSFHFTQ